MAKKKLTPEQEKEIKLLQANNEMLYKTAEEAKLRGQEKSVERIELARQDVIEQLRKIDSSLAEEAITLQDESDDTRVLEMLNNENNASVYDVLENKNIEPQIIESEPVYETVTEEVTPLQANSADFEAIDTDIQYDIISLPSNGEGYKNKMGRLAVGYLNAYDENLITSPNLYKDGLIIDFLLKNKVLNKNINIDDLYSGDADAIILFLRATSYGVDFPIVVRDPESGERIETTVDLSTLKAKEFTLKGDENGYFEYELPVSKDKVKFKFLTRKDEKSLRFLSTLESDAIKAQTMKSNVQALTSAIKSESTLTGKEKAEIIGGFKKIENLIGKLEMSKTVPFSKSITNRLEMNVVSINGNADRKFVAKYIRNMGARDSLMLRRYINEHEPGIDFTITVNRPESLGGGSFETFLEWDDSVFLNIA